jgi:hypothetical protein
MTKTGVAKYPPKFRIPEMGSTLTPAGHRLLRNLIDEWERANRSRRSEIEQHVEQILLAKWKSW